MATLCGFAADESGEWRVKSEDEFRNEFYLIQRAACGDNHISTLHS
ncbi:MAG: hypothetical protein ACI4RP_09365 [Acutalibacteraceae bacterium]